MALIVIDFLLVLLNKAMYLELIYFVSLMKKFRDVFDRLNTTRDTRTDRSV